MTNAMKVASTIGLVEGIQLRERLLVPKWLGRLIIWMFFHRVDTCTQIEITGLSYRLAPPSQEGK